MDTLEEVAAQVVRLAVAGGLPLLVTLALLLVCSLALVLARHLPRPGPPPDPDPGLRPSQPDDPTGPVPASQWGTHDDPDDRPPG